MSSCFKYILIPFCAYTCSVHLFLLSSRVCFYIGFPCVESQCTIKLCCVLSKQESFAEENITVSGMTSGQKISSLDSAGSSERNSERTHSVGPLKDMASLSFRLMRVQGLPSWTNTSSVAIQDVIQVLLI